MMPLQWRCLAPASLMSLNWRLEFARLDQQP
jgi:hypothetical protein